MKITRLKLPGRIGRSMLFLLIQLFCYQLANAQTVVKGTVNDETGQPLPGVTVQVKGKATAVGTDANGEFTVNAGKSDVLRISFVGYQVTEVLVGDQTHISISLKPEAKNLDEVIVTGYSKQSKHDVTGAASTISADVIHQAPVTSLEGALEGRVAGVTVDGQGGPGNSASIRIRGVGTFGNNDPLYVIDGVQIRVGTAGESQDISNLLNPSDIESITVLKDPSLIALYGARGSNGVIVITTKTGKIGAPTLQYDGYIGAEHPKDLLKLITPQQQADALYASYKNAGSDIPSSVSSFYGTGTKPVLPDYIIEDISSGAGNIGVMSGSGLADPSKYNFNSYRILKANKTGTDWWGLLFKSALTQNHNLSLSGATDKSNYAVTLGYMNDEGTLLNTYFQRYSMRVNTQFKIKPWLRFGENLEGSFVSQNTETRGATNVIQELYMLSPLLPAYDIQGNPSGTGKALILGNTSNPYLDRVNAKNDHNYSQSIVGSFYGEADLFKGLTYTNQIGFQLFPTEFHSYSPETPQEPINGANTFSEGGDYTTDWRWLNKLSYTTTINKVNNINVFAGYEIEKMVERSYGGYVLNILYPSEGTEYLSNSNTFPTQPVFGGGVKSTSISAFANLTYSLYDKYLFTATGRRDGSSKFGPASEYGNFGAVSAGWRISQENFLKDVSWLNDLKIRASYGTVGNDNIGQLYLTTLATGQFGNYGLGGTNTTSIDGFYLYQFGNPYLHWETNKTTNIGFDAALFHSSLTASFNWYDRETVGLLFTPPSPGTAGSALSPVENIMNLTNKGIELELNYKSHIGKVNYDMGFNIATVKNNIKYIDGIPGENFAGGVIGSNGANTLIREEVGHPVSSFYGFVYQGLFRSQSDIDGHADETSIGTPKDKALGHVMFKDLNGDNKIDLDNDRTFLGSPIPKFTYGYNLNLNYKNFDVGLFFQGSYGNKIYNYAKALQNYPFANGSGLNGGGLITGSLDTWSPSNINAKLPIYQQNSTAQDLSPSSLFIESGSYLRLKTTQVGYTFTNLKGIKRLRIYAQAFNLLTITKYSGMDPEVNDGDPNNLGVDYGTAYPISQKFLFGVNLGL